MMSVVFLKQVTPKVRLQRAARERARASRVAQATRYIDMALAVIENGKPFVRHWSDEGDVETGPMGFTEFGYRWGDLMVCLTPNGQLVLERGKCDNDRWGAPLLYVNVREAEYDPSPYAGRVAMIKDHLRALARNADRNGIEFVRTGKRPTDPADPYHLDNILTREASARA